MSLQATLQAAEDLLHATSRQALQDFSVGPLLGGVQVPPQGAAEEQGVLRHNGDAPPQQPQAHFCNIHAADKDASTSWLHEAEEAGEQGGLATASASDNAHLLPGPQLRRQAADHQRQVWPVANLQVVKHDRWKLAGPALSKSKLIPWQLPWGFLGKFRELYRPLDRGKARFHLNQKEGRPSQVLRQLHAVDQRQGGNAGWHQIRQSPEKCC
mmetsp:Transcript_11683/g.18639  ORF Transcript_11683/g.18639 Transcript_11683/m.18639 type:complete len:212 (-) Transcript_11683:580-1215(-)